MSSNLRKKYNQDALLPCAEPIKSVADVANNLGSKKNGYSHNYDIIMLRTKLICCH